MWTAKWILDAYEEGNEAVRLEMYLAYPDLRNHFDELEIRPVKSTIADALPASDKNAEAWWSFCCRLVRG